jgi:non-ribosomal peptide synthetase component F
MRLLARLHSHGQTHLNVSDLFAASTLARQAELLRTPSAPADRSVSPVRYAGVPGEPSPLSCGQQYIWALDLLAGSPGIYHVPLILSLVGALDTLALYQALYELMRRHESLRATVRLLKGSPVLSITEVPVPALLLVKVPLAPAVEALASEELDRQPEVLRAIQAEIVRPFEPDAGSLLRACLLRIRSDHAILVLTMHQLIIDDWSLHIFQQELVELYNAFRAARPSPLAETALQYREVVAWQQARWPVLGPGDLACWKERLTPLPPALALPTDAPRPPLQTYEGTTFHARISAGLVQQLLAVGRQEGATLFMVLLTAFVLHLARCSGQEDLAVGTAVAGRSHPEMERLIGLFTHVLPLRVDLSGGPTVRELLRRVRTIVLEACEHQAPSLEQIIEAVHPQPDPSRAPLFQVFFALQYAPSSDVRFAGLVARRLELWPPTSEFDLSCLLEEHSYGLNVTLRYSTRLFTCATIERFQEQYQELLQGLCVQMESPIQDVCGSPSISVLPAMSVAEEPAAAEESGACGDEGVLLQGSLEETLAAIWQTVLGRPAIARNEHFFEIGGHSLLAMQVLVAVRERLQVTLSLRQFLDAPTLLELANLVEQARQSAPSMGRGERPAVEGGKDPTCARLVPVARSGELPLSFAQQRLWFLDQLEGASATYIMPAVLRLSGYLDLPVFQRSLREMARRHEVLRTTFLQEQGKPVLCIHRLSFPVLTVVDVPANSLLQEIRAEVRRPFDLAGGPLFRVRVLCSGPSEQIVIFTMHHIISDGWSLGIMARELSVLYNAFVAGRPSPLPDLPIQYADFAAWQRATVQGPRLSASLHYWEQRLCNAPTLQLPSDHPRQVSTTMPGATCSEQWPYAFTRDLLEFSTRRGLTLFMTLLTGFLALLAYHSGQEDITVGTPVANRPHPDLERLVGLFVNTLALRLDLSGDPTAYELFRRVREMTLDAYEHQDAPFEQIVESLRPRREPGRTPVFQVMFAFQNTPAASLELTGLQVYSVGSHTSTAKFDLSVSLEMHDEGLAVGTEYSTQLFEATTIQQFHRQYRVLLGHLTHHPQQPLSWVYRELAGPEIISTRREQEICSLTPGMIPDRTE